MVDYISKLQTYNYGIHLSYPIAYFKPNIAIKKSELIETGNLKIPDGESFRRTGLFYPSCLIHVSVPMVSLLCDYNYD